MVVGNVFAYLKRSSFIAQYVQYTAWPQKFGTRFNL